MQKHAVTVDFTTITGKLGAIVTGAEAALSEEVLTEVYKTAWFNELVQLAAVRAVTTVARFEEIRIVADSNVSAAQFDTAVEAKLKEFFVVKNVNRR